MCIVLTKELASGAWCRSNGSLAAAHLALGAMMAASDVSDRRKVERGLRNLAGCPLFFGN
jgi:mannose/cellobiose epimerase-like protein (N-acyl-D-glucosamine 2-epimerase family)